MAGLVDALNVSSAFGGGDIDFSLGDLASTGTYRVSSFNWKPRISGSGLPKLNTPGNWPTHYDPRELVLDLEGRLVGESPTAYWTARAALLAALVPPPNYDRDLFGHGTMTAELPGQSDVYLTVNLSDYDAPMTSQSGRSSEYRFSWVAPFGYWRKVSDDSVVIL